MWENDSFYSGTPISNDIPRDCQKYIVFIGVSFKTNPRYNDIGEKQSKLSLCRGIFHLFVKHGGKIAVRMSGKRRNKGIDLEIPATYTFQLHKKLSGSVEASAIPFHFQSRDD